MRSARLQTETFYRLLEGTAIRRAMVVARVRSRRRPHRLQNMKIIVYNADIIKVCANAVPMNGNAGVRRQSNTAEKNKLNFLRARYRIRNISVFKKIDNKNPNWMLPQLMRLHAAGALSAANNATTKNKQRKRE